MTNRKFDSPTIRESLTLCRDPRASAGLNTRLAKHLVDGKPITDGMDVPGHGKISLSKQDAKTVIMAEPVRFTKENIDKLDFGI